MEYIINQSCIFKICWSNKILTVYFDNENVVEFLDVPEGIKEGLINAVSPGSYMNRFIKDEFNYRTIKNPKGHEKRQLMHYKDTSVGLYATDKPELIPKDIKHLFFQLKYEEEG